MEDLTKSMISLPWAACLFGVKQAASLFNVQSPNQSVEEVTKGLQNSTEAMQHQLRGMFESTFKTGDWLQQGMTDMAFNLLTFNYLRK